MDVAQGPRAGGPTPARGTLRVTAFGSGSGDSGEPVRHSSVFVPGPSYDGMEDNDIRGFPDGGFQWAFNQVGQAHVRVGRNAALPMHLRYGEPEIFRVLQRWDGICLPPGSHVLGCSLSLSLEFTSDLEQRVMLYAVNRDWNPGSGGVHGNNVSVANPGEVWWNEVGFGEREWGLPGAGYAADRPDADTRMMPLADAMIRPGDRVIDFQSQELTDYAHERLGRGQPLLFLLKLSDTCEDEPGSLTGFYSASEGDSLSLTRRPRLHLTWAGPDPRVLLERRVFLEHGRSATLAVAGVPADSWIDVEFVSDPGYESPTIEWHGSGEAAEEKRNGTCEPFRAHSDAGHVVVRAVSNPVCLGDQVEIGFRDTWILAGPPELQDVHWECTSPTGVFRRLTGEYEGDYTWHLRFLPDEVGRWRYRLVHTFAESPYEGADGWSDVRVGKPEPALEVLRGLVSRITSARDGADVAELDRLRRQFIHLQRGLIREQTPDSLRSPAGVRMAEELRNVRSALWGETVPEVPPLESSRLYEEHEGVLLKDPIPYTRHLATRQPEAPTSRAARLRERIERRLRRTTERLRRRRKDIISSE